MEHGDNGLNLKKKILHLEVKELCIEGLDFVRDRFTDQCDGVTKTFTLSATPKANTVTVKSTQFPIIYDPDIDFTVDVTNRTVTLTSEVDAPQTGQTLIITYIKSGG